MNGSCVAMEQFATLISFEKNSLEVDQEAISKVFDGQRLSGIPFSIYLVLGKERNTRWNLLKKLIHQSSGVVIDDQINEDERPPRIVVWSNVLATTKDDGRLGSDFFLDIWGAFQPDPIYTMLSGVASTIASSIIYVEDEEINADSIFWLKCVGLTGLKCKLSKLQSLTFLVNNWTSNENFKAGLDGGQEYLKYIQEDKTCCKHSKDLFILFSKISCYLFPPGTNKLAHNQHAKKFMAIMIDEGGHYKITDGSEASSEEINYLFSDVKTIENYTDFEGEFLLQQLIQQKTDDKTEVLETSKSSFTESDDDVEDFPCLEKGAEIDKFLSEIFLEKLSLHVEVPPTKPISSMVENLMLNEHTEGVDWITSMDDLTIYTIEENGHENTSVNPTTTTTIQDDCLTNTIELQEGQSLSPCAAEFSSQLNLAKNVHLHVPSAEEIMESIFSNSKRAFLNTSENTVSDLLNDFLPPPKLKKESADHLNDIDKILKATLRALPEHADQLKENSAEIGGSMSVALSQDNFFSVEDHNTSFMVNAKLVLAREQPTSLSTIDDLLQQVSRMSQLDLDPNHKVYEDVRAKFCKVSQAVKNYQTNLEVCFQQQSFFNDDTDFSKASAEIKTFVLNDVETNLGDFRDILVSKIDQVENVYLCINSDIRTLELEAKEHALQLASDQYQINLDDSHCTSEDDIILQHKTAISQCKKAFINAFWVSTDNKEQHLFVVELEKRLLSALVAFKKKRSSEVETVKTLIKKHTQYVETKGNELINQTANYDDYQLNGCVQTVISDTMNQFKEDIKLLTGGIRIVGTKQFEQLIKEINSKQLEMLSKTKCKQGQNSNIKFTYQPPSISSSLNGELPQPLAIGIQISLDTISVGIYQNSKFRTLLGPMPSRISLDEEIMIGEQCSSSRSSFISLRQVLLCNKIDTTYKTSKETLRVEQIFACVLAKIHQTLASMLQTTNLEYIISLPTFCNATLRSALFFSVQIAGLKGDLVMESDCLCAYYLHSKNPPRKPFELLIISEDEATDSSDMAIYEIGQKHLQVMFVGGSNSAYVGYIKWTYKCGLQIALENLNSKRHSTQGYRVLLLGEKNSQRNLQIIQNFKGSIHILHDNSKEIVLKGATLLAVYKSSDKFKTDWNRKHNPFILEPLNQTLEMKSNFCKHRVNHSGKPLTASQVSTIAINLQTKLQSFSKILSKAKADAEQVCLEKINYLEQNTAIDETTREKHIKMVSDVLRAIQKEETIASVTQQIHSVNQIT